MRDFTKGNVPKQLIKFALPIIAGNLLQSLYIVIDAVWVGRLLGHQALAAVSATFPILFFLISLLIGLSVATNILVGQSYGAKDRETLSKVLTNSFLAVISLSLSISAVSMFFCSPLLDIINTPGSIKPDAYTYLFIVLAGLIFRAAYNWFGGVLRGLGDSRTPLIILLISVVCNIILTPLLILGIGPLPRLGIAGSALGTIASAFISIFFGYMYLIRKNDLLDIRRWKYKLAFPAIKRLFVVGVPASGQIMVRSLSWVALVALVNKFGTTLIAAYGIGIRIDMFAFMPALSVGMAVSSMAAQNIGGRQIERVPVLLHCSVLVSLFFSVLFYCLVNIFPRAIAGVFTSNEEVIRHTIGYIRIVSLDYFLLPFIFSLQGIIRGAGHTHYLLVFTVISMLLVRVPLAYVLAQYTRLQELGIWLGILLSAFTAVMFNYLYYRSQRWFNHSAE
jgi:putative MATE family efflux protein